MDQTANSSLAVTSHSRRFIVALTFGVLIAAYSLIISRGIEDPRTAVLIDDAVWTLFSLATAIVCFNAARRLPDRERRAWRIIGYGCLAWFAGQCVWNYFELVRNELPEYPHWVQILFLLYPVLLVTGLLTLPKPAETGSTVRRAGNLGLLICTMALLFVVALTEPAFESGRRTITVAAQLVHGSSYGIACVIAMYLLWSYRWRAAYWPLILIIMGLCFHTAAFIFDVQNRMVGTYQAAHWTQLAWLMSFTGTALAAHEFAWSSVRGAEPALPSLLLRERLLEAALPALLILSIAGTVALNTAWISPRVLYMCSVIGLTFIAVLGLREAWVQREEHRLVAAVNASRDEVLAAYEELRRSEQQVRLLNADLERRVSERTLELQGAYRELESFSYAVAHDIKAPLRAINSFGALLAEEYASHLDERAQDYVHRMRRGSLYLAQLVDDLLAYANIERRELTVRTFDVADMLARCVAEQEETIAQAGAEVRLETSSIQVTADPEALALVVRNLLQNALKFSRQTEAPRIVVRTQLDAGCLRIIVSDNGIGFDMQFHDRIFALFQRLHRPEEYAGTGIGLALARKAVERLRGRIWAESRPGLGATFFIELPGEGVSPSPITPSKQTATSYERSATST